MAAPAEFLLPLDQLPDPLPIPPLTRPFNTTVRPPGSKSLTNRALLLAALADGTSTLRGALVDADDARVMIRALEQLGAKIEGATDTGATGSLLPVSGIPVPTSTGSKLPGAPGNTTLRITGVNGRWKIPPGETVTLNLQNAGTATRFLAAAALLAPPTTSIVIDGDARMRERPIGELGDTLIHLGARVRYMGQHGFPPLRVSPPPTDAPREVAFGRTSSGQFISAMLLVAPFLPRGLTISLTQTPTSKPYIEMTERLMRALAVPFDANTPGFVHAWGTNADTLRCPRHRLASFDLDIEPDFSGAGYFWAAAAIIPGSCVTIEGFDAPTRCSTQGDAGFLEVLGEQGFGGDTGIDEGTTRCSGLAILYPVREISLSDMPDTAMTAAVLACFASPTEANPTATTTLRGLRTLRVKETDRLAALQTELSKLGTHVEIFQDGDDEGLRITPPTPAQLEAATTRPILFDTYHDHRMAMSLALVGLRIPNIYIKDPACVAKTYPTFWRDFARLYQ